MTTRILLIEDNAKDQRLVEIALAEATSFEHTLQAKKSLEEGLAHMDAHPTDVVLLDLNLTDSTGLSSLERVLDTHPEVPVIVLTGLADESLGDQAIRAGAQDFLVKGKMFGELLYRAIRYAKERHSILLKLREAAE